MVALIPSAMGAATSQTTQACLPKPGGAGGLQLSGGVGAWGKGTKVQTDSGET